MVSPALQMFVPAWSLSVRGPAAPHDLVCLVTFYPDETHVSTTKDINGICVFVLLCRLAKKLYGGEPVFMTHAAVLVKAFIDSLAVCLTLRSKDSIIRNMLTLCVCCSVPVQ